MTDNDKYLADNNSTTEQQSSLIPSSSFPITYFNRDLSWIDFNARVLEEGLRQDLPLFERFRFLSIVASNFDEFFMVRVAAIKRALRANTAADPSGLSPAEQLKEVAEKTHALTCRQYDCLRNEIFPGLARGGLELLRPDSYTVPQMDFLESFFMGQIYPILTPLRIADNEPLPFIESRGVYAAFLLVPDLARRVNEAEAETVAENAGEHIVIVRLPPALSRIIWLPKPEPPPASVGGTQTKGSLGESSSADTESERLQWALLDDVALTWGGYLFPGYRVTESMLFKVNRDADFSVDERRDEDFIEAMEEVLEGREKSDAVRMVYSPGSARLRDELASRFSLGEDDLYELDGPLNIADLLELAGVAGFEEMQEKPWKIHPTTAFSEDAPVWDRISQGDVMLHLPYQSFDPVVRFFQEAAVDPQVISIKTTLYRTGGALPGAAAGASAVISPVVRALEQAALNGKHVTALVELKARFDEERNISWANRLEKAGVIVVYGLSRLKVHSKITMVMRREHERIKRYVHLSTGNYNDKTAKFYEDICLFTCREDIAYDTGLLFNMLTGYSLIQAMTRLVIAPAGLKPRLLDLIERETRRTGQKYPGKIMVKLNALTDTDIISALYRASQAGVKVMLCVRGICTLVPGLPQLSENIRVISIIDHYLEHSRMYYFANGGAEELYLSSADWMPRNLERRVELMFPVQDEKIRAELRDTLNAYFQDNCQARSLNADGTWTRLSPPDREKSFRIQRDILSRAAREAGGPGPVKQEFIVRRGNPGEK
ncbi:RNA degradosome polyphosphate kinase [Spirochaetia bacterium]|nr:RNA degradosome polyphosphate kinase [Spirochaetia bacterium]